MLDFSFFLGGFFEEVDTVGEILRGSEKLENGGEVFVREELSLELLTIDLQARMKDLDLLQGDNFCGQLRIQVRGMVYLFELVVISQELTTEVRVPPAQQHRDPLMVRFLVFEKLPVYEFRELVVLRLDSPISFSCVGIELS